MGKKIIVRVDSSDGLKLDEEDWLVHATSVGVSDYATICGLAPDYFTYQDFDGFVGAEFVTEPITCPNCIDLLEESRNFRKKNSKWY